MRARALLLSLLVGAIVVIVALIWHAWVGVCSVWYDYAKPAGLRLVLQALSAIWLVSCGGWAVQVLWRL